ncbi:MAG: Ig-like domain-containing protein [Huintestinicola sp.]
MTLAKQYLKSFLCTVLALLLSLSMVSIPASAASYSLNRTSYTLTKGYSITLKVNGASSSDVSWSSSDKSVATVNSSGKVVGKSAGTATITASVNGTSLKSVITVVGGKLSVDTKTVTVDEGGSTYVYVTAKGSHGLKAVPSDRSIATASWVTPWDGNTIRLKINGKSSGSASIKVYLTKYPDIYTTIKVNVAGSNDSLLTSATNVSAAVNGTASVMVYANPAQGLTYSFSDSTIAKVSEGKWSNNYCTLTITGLKAGTTTLTISKSASLQKKVYITVTGDSSVYYVVTTTQPTKQLTTDQILKWKDPKTLVTKYMLVPKDYDTAYVNSLIAKDKGSYDYYAIFDTTPVKQASTDSILEFITTVNGKEVKRYVLVPTGYDKGAYNSAVAQYTGKYEYWTIYNTTPTKIYGTDIVYSYVANVNYTSVTRYVLLPYGYSEEKLNQLIASDSGTATDGYYSVYTSTPQKKNPTDIVLSFYGTKDGVSTLYYVLVPADYDEAKYNDVVAAYTGMYSYWTIYTVKPKQNLPTDVIQSWTKIINSKNTTRYILLPYGYSEELLTQIKNKDLGSQTSSYYVVSTTIPSLIESTDTIYQWYNASAKTFKYMLLPANPNILKRNDIVYADTKVFEYYTIYSTSPTKIKSDDVVLKLYSSTYGQYIYMLVPVDYTADKVTKAMNGETVTV